MKKLLTILLVVWAGSAGASDVVVGSLSTGVWTRTAYDANNYVLTWAADGGALGDLVLFYEYDGDLTNGAGMVVDSSGAGNHGTPGAGAAEPTWSEATGVMTNIVTYDGGDYVTSTVTQAKSTIMFWASVGSVWRSYIKNGAAEYVDGLASSFTESNFYSQNGDNFGWGSGFTGGQTLQRIWQTGQTDYNNMHWTQAVHMGWSQWDYDNRSDWDKVDWVGTFNYPYPANSSSSVGHHGVLPGGAASPTHTVDGNLSYYDFDEGDYINVGSSSTWPTDGVNSGYLTIIAWIKPRTFVSQAGIVMASGGLGQNGLVLHATPASETITFRVDAGSTYSRNGVAGAIVSNEWNLVVGTYQWNGSPRMILYTFSSAGTNKTTATAAAANLTAVDIYRVGWYDFNAAFKFDGGIDNVRIYSGGGGNTWSGATVTNYWNANKANYGF